MWRPKLNGSPPSPPEYTVPCWRSPVYVPMRSFPVSCVRNTSVGRSSSRSPAQPRARPRSKKLLLPCPLVSARSPRRRRAASWCPRRSGRRKSARSRSEEEPEERLMPEFLLAKRRRAKDPTLLFSSRYDMMACVDKDKSSSYPERSAGVTGILTTQEGTLV